MPCHERLYGGLRHRVLAFAYDYLLIAAYLAVLTAAGRGLAAWAPGILRGLGDPVRGQLAVFGVLTLPVILYFALGEASARQATWGKTRVRLRVARHDGARMSFGRALIRSLLKFIPWEITHTCVWQFWTHPQSPPDWATWLLVLVWALVGANLVSAWVSPARQALYDRVAGTVVLRSVPAAAARRHPAPAL